MQRANYLHAETKRRFYGIIFVHWVAAWSNKVAAAAKEGYHEAMGKRNIGSWKAFCKNLRGRKY